MFHISIHALVKRATSERSKGTPTPTISIHALVKRATLYQAVYADEDMISIHALVKRATCKSNNTTPTEFVFQSTPS